MARELMLMNAVNEALDMAMEKDESVFLLGEDIHGGTEVAHLEEENVDAWGGVMGVTKGLGPKYGTDRVIDTPLSEMGYMAAAVGAAATGLRPVAELMFNDFIGFAFDSILGQGSKMRYMFGGKAKIPLTVRTMAGAGASAAAQHSGSYHSIFAHIPGVKVVYPVTAYDAKGLLLESIFDDDMVIFMEDKTTYSITDEVPEDYYTVPIGKAAVRREGEDLTIVTIGKMMYVALEVAERLEKEGVSVEVIDLRTVKPWDEETVMRSVMKTNRLIVLDEANPTASMARDIASVVQEKAFDYLDGPVKTVTAPDAPVPFAVNLEQAYIPDADKVLKECNEIIEDLKG